MAGFLGSLGKKWQQIENIDKTIAAYFLSAAQGSAMQVVDDLQKKGPSWTGKFSNSWQIETRTPGLEWRGTMEEGEFVSPFDDGSGGPKVTMRDARDVLEKGKIAFRVSNVSPRNNNGQEYAEFATDRREGEFSGKWAGSEPKTQHGKNKWQFRKTKRNIPDMRGNIGSGTEEGFSSRTAREDWFDRYINEEMTDTIKKTVNLRLKGKL